MQWTPEQTEAIYHRGSDLLVSAAAGSGKTAVLVERIRVFLLEDRVDIDRLLVVTFTRAAAAEMRQRIQQSLLQALEQGNEDVDHIQHQLDLLPEASISTIHSFCTQILRRYYYLVELSPDFRIGDVTEMELLKAELIEEVLEQEYELGEPLLIELLEWLGGRIDDRPLQDKLLRLHEFMRSKVDGEGWLQQSISALHDNSTAEQNIWLSRAHAAIMQRLPLISAPLQAALTLAQQGQLTPYMESLQADLERLQELEEMLNRNLIPASLGNLLQFKFGRLKNAPKDCDESLKIEIKSLREGAKRQIDNLKQRFAFKPLDDMRTDMQAMIPGLQYLHRIVSNFSARYQQEKRRRNQVDYNDLEQLSLVVLNHPAAAEEYRERFVQVMVDEYQDSNEVQEAILQALSRPGCRFMVGDVKQSIYRFRLAAPEIFMHYYEAFRQEDSGGHCIDLRTNFRSEPLLIMGVNHIFSRLMRRDYAEIDYDERAALEAGLPPHQFDSGGIAAILIDRGRAVEARETDDPIPVEENSERDERKDIEQEALFIRQQIGEYLGRPFYDHKQDCIRPLQYRDMVILLRSSRGRAPLLAEILQEGGTPVYSDSNNSYFEATEVQIILNILQLLDNCEQDLPLLSTLHSPLFEFDLSQLAHIRQTHGLGNGSYWQALLSYAEQEGELAEKVRDFIAQIEHWQFLCIFLPVDDLIWAILQQSGYYHYVLALPGGEQRQANLRQLLDQARTFAAGSLSGLYAFLHFMERVKNNVGDLGSASLLGENSDLVRIMSIHKSKGLEFPIVFVCGMGQQFNLRDLSQDMLLHREWGIGLRYVDTERRVISESLSRAVIREQMHQEQLAEELRILYVALTRAQHRLVLLGTVKDLSRSAAEWKIDRSSDQFRSAKRFLDWLGPILLEAEDNPAVGCGIKLQVYAPDDGRRNRLSVESVPVEVPGQTLHNPVSSEDWSTEVGRRLNWTYPYAAASQTLSKQNVSQLSHAIASAEGGYRIGMEWKRQPDFMSPLSGLSAAERGSLYHLALQHIPLNVRTEEEITAAVDELQQREIIGADERSLIDTALLWDFFKSSLGSRLCTAEKVYRELSFNYLVNAEHPVPGHEDLQPGMLIQGIIDLCFLETGQWVLVDYKSDQADDKTILRRYREQLVLYRLALEQISGITVKQAFFWHLPSGHAIPLDS